MNSFNFYPSEGLRDKNAFPTYPASEEEARNQLQTPLDQIRDFINTSLITNMQSWDSFKTNGGRIYGSIVLNSNGSTNFVPFETVRVVNGKQVKSTIGIVNYDGTNGVGATGIQLVDLDTSATLGSFYLNGTGIYGYGNSQELDIGATSKKFKDIYMSGNGTFGGGISANGDVSIGGALTTAMNINANRNVYVSGFIETTGAATINGQFNAKGNAYIDGSAQIKGNATVNGNMNLLGNDLNNGYYKTFNGFSEQFGETYPTVPIVPANTIDIAYKFPFTTKAVNPKITVTATESSTGNAVPLGLRIVNVGLDKIQIRLSNDTGKTLSGVKVNWSILGI